MLVAGHRQNRNTYRRHEAGESSPDEMDSDDNESSRHRRSSNGLEYPIGFESDYERDVSDELGTEEHEAFYRPQSQDRQDSANFDEYSDDEAAPVSAYSTACEADRLDIARERHMLLEVGRRQRQRRELQPQGLIL